MPSAHAPPITGPHAPLYKQRSWSPDLGRDEAWLRRKRSSRGKSRSVTDEDLDELKACIELGFGFDSGSPEPADPRLAVTLPALGLYYAVNKNYTDSLGVTTPSECSSASPSPTGSPQTMFGPEDTPQTVKARLRQWAQVVACSVRQGTS